jgi:cell division protein FtsW (lipid II flippase)
MILWIIIGVVVAILISSFFHAEHLFNRVKIFIFVLIALIVLYSIFGFFFSGKADLSSPGAIASSVYSYFGWIGDKSIQIFNVGKDSVGLVGNIIKSNDSIRQDVKDGRK